MARLGSERVDDVLDYERDIKGKGLVRLRAGVGAGKNYWASHLLEKHPDLQILLITSRKNTAEAQAIQIGTDCKIHISKLIDIDDKDWLEDFPGNMLVCANAYIEYFFKNIFKIDDPKTHLWNKFDLIFVDEVHSLTVDASFADCPFYVERFIHYTLKMNPNCDVVAMSGTPASTDWLFTDEHWGSRYTSIDLYTQCIHLVPDFVSLVSKVSVAKTIYALWSHGHRLIYFANSVRNMAALIAKLQDMGIPVNDMGVAYTSSGNEDLLPDILTTGKERLREYLVSKSSIPQNVRIFVTTSQNKEGISIADDDIKYMFSESHNKTDLEQMAGRVRGNPENGTGLRCLAIIFDVDAFSLLPGYVEKELDRALVDQVEFVLKKHEKIILDLGKNYDYRNDIELVHKNHSFIRYDFIGRCFCFYKGREESALQQNDDQLTFHSCMDLWDQPLRSETRMVEGHWVNIKVTGASELQETWFPHSILSFPKVDTPKEEAKKELVAFLIEKGYVNTLLDSSKEAEIMNQIYTLIQKYGYKQLGFHNKKNALPKTLRPALNHFGIQAENPRSHKEKGHYICLEAIVGDQT